MPEANSGVATTSCASYAAGCFATARILSFKRQFVKVAFVSALLVFVVVVKLVVWSDMLGRAVPQLKPFLGNGALEPAGATLLLLILAAYLATIDRGYRLIGKATGLSRKDCEHWLRMYRSNSKFAADVGRFGSMSVEMIDTVLHHENG